MLRYHDVSRLVFLVDMDFLHFGRSQSLCDELGDIIPPLDDIDFLASKLVHDLTHSRTSRSDAGTLGVHVWIVGYHSDLGAMPRLACNADDLDRAICQLGHFEL